MVRRAAEGKKELLWVAIKRFVQKKSFFQHTAAIISHRNKTNEQQPFSNTACYCELVVK